MIFAHHAGETLLPALVASGVGTAPILLAIGRARLALLFERLRRR